MKANQRGRSMIEMLGVLAIIGVLSVGGIAGFSKAMQKHKINQTINQVSMVAGGIQKLFATQWMRYVGADNMETLVKANIVSQDMIEEHGSNEIDWDSFADIASSGTIDQWKTVYEYGLAHPDSFCGHGIRADYGYQKCMDDVDAALRDHFGIPLSSYSKVITTPLGAYMSITAGNKVFALTLSGVSQEACIDLVTKDWGSSTADFVGLSVGNQSNTFGTMAVDQAIAGCSSDSNNISFMFK